jgi:hypothetical protein
MAARFETENISAVDAMVISSNFEALVKWPKAGGGCGLWGHLLCVMSAAITLKGGHWIRSAKSGNFRFADNPT